MRWILQQFQRPYLYLFVIIIGTAIKLYYLDHKYFWLDEIYTIEHTSGIPTSEYADLFPVNEIRNISYYHDILHLNTQDYAIADQVRGMINSPNFSPVHYFFLMFWTKIIGDDYLDYRMFSIFCYLLTLLFLFKLVETLFKSRLTAWIVVSLFSVSPFLHVYILEARYYILWICSITALSYCYLMAIKSKKTSWWIAYIVTGIIALYSSTFSAFILLGQSIHFIIVNRKYTWAYIISSLIIIIVYSPWLYIIFTNLDQILSSLSWQLGWQDTQQTWEPLAWQLFGFTHTIATLEPHIWSSFPMISGGFSSILIIQIYVSVLILALIIIAAIHMVRRSTKEEWTFIALFILPTLLFFYLLDVIRNSYVSPTWRYSLINFIGILIIIAYYLGKKIQSRMAVFYGLYLALATICILSIFSITKNQCWYAFEDDCNHRMNEAAIFTQNERPLVITDYSHWMEINGFFAMVIQCKSDNIDILRADHDINYFDIFTSGNRYSDIYVMHASDELIKSLKSQLGNSIYPLDLDNTSQLWKIKKISNYDR